MPIILAFFAAMMVCQFFWAVFFMPETKTNAKCRIGRTHADLLKWLKANPGVGRTSPPGVNMGDSWEKD